MSMMQSGLVSVTFRQKSVAEICELCARAGLRAVEWGGDVHVPPEDAAAVDSARRLSAAHGLAISSYGSYYRIGRPTAQFIQNLRAAEGLGAPVMRIWGGQAGSANLAEDVRRAWTAQLIECARLAANAGVRLALEYHGGTLTDARESTLRLVADTACVTDSLTFYWQPRWDWPTAERLASLEDVRTRLSYLHVFTWLHRDGQTLRRPLADGEGLWRGVLDGLRTREGYALLEFVEDDSDEALLHDAKTLNEWLSL